MRIKKTLTITLSLLVSIPIFSQIRFDVNEVDLGGCTVLINTSDNTINAKRGSETLISMHYYSIRVTENRRRIGFGLSQGTTPLTSPDNSQHFFIVTDKGIMYNKPQTPINKQYSFRAGVSYSSSFSSLLSAVGPKTGNNPVSTPSASSGSNRTFNVKGVTFTMVYVQGGTFQMGSNTGESDEKPVHSVTLSSYYIGQTEVTQELWEAVMGSNPSFFKGSKRPVEKVSWNDCQDFVNELSRLTGERFHLPTEAQWEFAARGGVKSTGCNYAGSNAIATVAWYEENSYKKGSDNPDYGTHTVATKSPNELGIYDMSGNVWEWCQDWYDSYSSSSQTNPTGPSAGSYRVNRGGGWLSAASRCRAARRSLDTPSSTLDNLGLRLAL